MSVLLTKNDTKETVLFIKGAAEKLIESAGFILT